jgi:hypothetical protein
VTCERLELLGRQPDADCTVAADEPADPWRLMGMLKGKATKHFDFHHQSLLNAYGLALIVCISLIKGDDGIGQDDALVGCFWAHAVRDRLGLVNERLKRFGGDLRSGTEWALKCARSAPRGGTRFSA